MIIHNPIARRRHGGSAQSRTHLILFWSLGTAWNRVATELAGSRMYHVLPFSARHQLNDLCKQLELLSQAIWLWAITVIHTAASALPDTNAKSPPWARPCCAKSARAQPGWNWGLPCAVFVGTWQADGTHAGCAVIAPDHEKSLLQHEFACH